MYAHEKKGYTDMRPNPNEGCGFCAVAWVMFLALVLLPIVIAWPLVGVAISAVTFVIHLRRAIGGGSGNNRALLTLNLAEVRVMHRSHDDEHYTGRRDLLSFRWLKRLAYGASLALSQMRAWHVNLPTWRITNPRVASAH